MEKVYQVFVSSTYSDLKDERRRVSDTLSKAGFISAGMELFPAADQQQFDFIKRVIDRCDYYVVVVGGRYGSLADEKISFTEMEYEYARGRNIPVLAFLHRKPEDIAVGKTDQNEEQANRLRRFRDELARGRMVDFWTDASDLCTTVTIAVMNAANLSPGIGWVRGDQAIDSKVLQELERLRIDNEKLKAIVAETNEGKIVFPVGLSGPEEEIHLEIYDANARTVVGTLDTSFKEIFIELFESLVTQQSEEEICRQVGQIWGHRSGKLGPRQPHHLFYLAPEASLNLRSHLEALGLIQSIGRTRQYDMFGTMRTATFLAWSITERGRKYMASLRALRRNEDGSN